MSTFVMVPTAGSVTLGAGPTAVGDQCIASVVSATQSEEQFETMAGVTVVYGATLFYLELEYAQDWRTTGISYFLWQNDGANVAFSFSPTVDGTPKMAGTCRARRGAFGGNMGRASRDRVRLAVVGVPTLTPDS